LPTPVSSLLHAATLVTAGIYLLMRSSPLLEYSPTTLFIITIMGALTTIFAATSGLLQNDIKRIIAFSTISQLGYSLIKIIKINYILFNWFILYLIINYFYSYSYELIIINIINNNYFTFASFFILVKFKIKNKKIKNQLNFSNDSKNTLIVKDNKNINYIDKFNNFSLNNKLIIKSKYNKVSGIYMWVNNITCEATNVI
jgi:NADH:ubiquinone oxidoreductase subunit 4 (subunit M)